MKRGVSFLKHTIMLLITVETLVIGFVFTHSVLCVQGGSIVDQVLNAVQVSRPHGNMERSTVQLDTVEQVF